MHLVMLTNRREFQKVKAGVSFGTKGFLLQARQRQTDEITTSGPRFGITVSNHTVRRNFIQKRSQPTDNKDKTNLRRGPISVSRNRMRRRLREALRALVPKFALDGFDYVIIGKQGLDTLSFDFILKDLEKSFQKVHRRIISTHKHIKH